MKRFIVDELSAKMRADVFLAEKYPQFARAAIAKLFPADKVVMNGIPQKAGYKLKVGDKIVVEDSWLREREFDPIKLEILYEDDSVLVIDKPAGVLSHARGGLSTEASVASFLRGHIDPTTTGAGRAGIVHRLDRATSGVMICAKNSSSQSYLQKQFHDRKVNKTYLAVVSPPPKHNKAIIDAPIDRDPKHPKRFKISPQGKSALTDYEVLLTSSNGRYAMIKFRPQTGRTHQLRVHAMYINSPIVGDELYGGVQSARLCLHAAELEIDVPDSGRQVFHSKTPSIFFEYVPR